MSRQAFYNKNKRFSTDKQSNIQQSYLNKNMRKNYHNFYESNYHSPKNSFQPVLKPYSMSPSLPSTFSSQPSSKTLLLSLLKQIKLPASQYVKFEYINDIEELIVASIPLIKTKFQQLTQNAQSLSIEIQSLKIQNAKSLLSNEEIADLTSKFNIKESSMKLRIENVQKQWQNANENLLKVRKQLEQMDNELFDKNKQISHIQQQNRVLTRSIELLTKQLKENIAKHKQKQKQFERIKQTYRLQQSQIFRILEIKQDEIEQLNIKNNFTQQEYEIIQRQYVRWKERYLQQNQEQRAQAQIINEHYEERNRSNRNQSNNLYQAESPRNIDSMRTNQQHCRQCMQHTEAEQKIRNLNEQLRVLNQKFKAANEEKIKLFVELEQVKEFLLTHGIEYDSIEDAPLVQLLRKQRMASRGQRRP